MPDARRPAWSRGSSVYAPLPKAGDPLVVSPEWAWGHAAGGGVRVAVVDSGVEASHPDLGGCVDEADGVAVTLDERGEAVVEAGPHDDLFGHGTACAGIIHSLAPQARIVSVRVLGAGLKGKSAAFLRGLAWAVEQGFDVINLSLGTAKRDWALPFYELCDEAYYRGSLVVTAANNIARPSYPSLYASVASVACNISTDPTEFHFNPAPPTELLARGINVAVAWRGGGHRKVTGNSFAAPHISGLAALVKSKHPELRPMQVRTVLCATAANVRGSAGHAQPASEPAADRGRVAPAQVGTALFSLAELMKRYPELTPTGQGAAAGAPVERPSRSDAAVAGGVRQRPKELGT